MSQFMKLGSGAIPPGTYIEQLQGDQGTPVGGAIVNILGNGDVTPTTLGNSGIVFTGDGVSTLSATVSYINMPNTVVGSYEGILYKGSVPFLHDSPGAGGGNVFLGRSAGSTTRTVATNGNNTGIGDGALAQLQGITDATANTAIGNGALFSLTTGYSNIALGRFAGGFTALTGGRNILIGNATAASWSGTESNNCYIGDSLGGTSENNVLRIGSATGTAPGEFQSAFIHGIAGVSVSNPLNVVINSATGQLGTGPAVDLVTYTNVNTTPYVVLSTDEFLGVDCSGGAIQINLPNAPSTGRVYYIKDRTGSANTNAITITTVGGAVLIDGATSFVMNTSYESVNILFDGTTYQIF